MNKLAVVLFSSWALTSTAFATNTDDLLQQLEGQLKTLHDQQQSQMDQMNSKIQNQLKQIQSQLQDQIQKSNEMTQNQIKQVQTTLQQQIKVVHEEVMQNKGG